MACPYLIVPCRALADQATEGAIAAEQGQGTLASCPHCLAGPAQVIILTLHQMPEGFKHYFTRLDKQLDRLREACIFQQSYMTDHLQYLKQIAIKQKATLLQVKPQLELARATKKHCEQLQAENEALRARLQQHEQVPVHMTPDLTRARPSSRAPQAASSHPAAMTMGSHDRLSLPHDPIRTAPPSSRSSAIVPFRPPEIHRSASLATTPSKRSRYTPAANPAHLHTSPSTRSTPRPSSVLRQPMPLRTTSALERFRYTSPRSMSRQSGSSAMPPPPLPFTRRGVN
ncbi:uncharacterized protein L969DRAFT_46933 [Mixia osmundae IAM 14324]|uniref:Uncharacterized protein n=1 Tax=Mixia osmundae (strain CBS 9802 / IAM 14324 / JCM 22182 / KY 12970) TaxID=764103 RepID=G7DSB4_MIXOS|nr:uncharacterized protein L969DRAFT_46933 [Mixia osmundae IAM 14324]KEI40926.1 hypothetical protein L969DRAFT_46933 [Mixia osmundae IAM 14324]GAA93474.1 hypothetical protein E5Q_00115 [Mixia osmundae IAM 14324]